MPVNGLTPGAEYAFRVRTVGDSTGYNDWSNTQNYRSTLVLSGTPKVAVSGAEAALFSVTTQPVSPISGPSGFTTFTVQFLPTSGGAKTATLSIPNNDSDESPFDITLTGQALSLTQDTDGDGLKDASEFQMAALGFDWQVAQPALVNTYYSNANGAGLYTTGQVQALNVGAPLLTKNAGTGRFKLTIGVKKTTNLGQPFIAFPMNGAGFTTVINGAGKLEFEFTVPDNAAFFRVESQ